MAWLHRLRASLSDPPRAVLAGLNLFARLGLTAAVVIPLDRRSSTRSEPKCAALRRVGGTNHQRSLLSIRRRGLYVTLSFTRLGRSHGSVLRGQKGTSSGCNRRGGLHNGACSGGGRRSLCVDAYPECSLRTHSGALRTNNAPCGRVVGGRR